MNSGTQMPCSLPEAVASVQMMVEHSQRLIEKYAENGGDFPPVYFVFTVDRGVDIIGFSWSNEKEKDGAATAMRLTAVQLQPAGLWGVMLITDTRWWEVDADLASRLGLSQEELSSMLRDAPWRIKELGKQTEALVVRLETYMGDWGVGLMYDRLDGNRISWHPPRDMITGVQSEGRLVNLLPPLPYCAGQA